MEGLTWRLWGSLLKCMVAGEAARHRSEGRDVRAGNKEKLFHSDDGQWNELPRKVLWSPFSEVFKLWQDEPVNDSVWPLSWSYKPLELTFFQVPFNLNYPNMFFRLLQKYRPYCWTASWKLGACCARPCTVTEITLLSQLIGNQSVGNTRTGSLWIQVPPPLGSYSAALLLGLISPIKCSRAADLHGPKSFAVTKTLQGGWAPTEVVQETQCLHSFQLLTLNGRKQFNPSETVFCLLWGLAPGLLLLTPLHNLRLCSNKGLELTVMSNLLPFIFLAVSCTPGSAVSLGLAQWLSQGRRNLSSLSRDVHLTWPFCSLKKI